MVTGLLVPDAALSVQRGARSAISTPETLARRYDFRPDARRSSLRLDIPATHAMVSWSGGRDSGVSFRYERDGLLTSWRRVPEAEDLAHGTRNYSAPLLLERTRSIAWRSVGGAHQVAIDYVNTLDGPSRSTPLGGSPTAVSGEPDIVTRAEWGADESWKRTTGSCERSFNEPQQVFIHHTVTRNHDPNPAATVRAMYYFHTRSRGWCDIGYNFLVSRDGRVFEGRWARPYAPWEVHDGEDRADRIAMGAHTAGYNSGSIGVSVLGNYESSRLTKATRRALVGFLGWEMDRHDLDPLGRHRYRNPSDGTTRSFRYIAGHRDGAETSCPGRFLYEALPSIRRSVAEAIGKERGHSVLSSTPAQPVDFGETATSEFRLTARAGAPLAGKVLAIYRRGGGAWRRIADLTTDEDGWARLAFVPKRNVRVAAVWAGSESRWGDDALLLQRVRPLVTLVPEGGLETTPGKYEFAQGTTEIFFSGAVEPDHAGQMVTVRVSQMGSAGSFGPWSTRSRRLNDVSAYRFRLAIPTEGGTFKVRAEMAKHSDHAFGRSRTVQVTVPPPLFPPAP